MKQPIKPFLVEVKRSRSRSSQADRAPAAPPVLIEQTAPPAPEVHSAARKMAEQAFNALAIKATPQRREIAAESLVWAIEPTVRTEEPAEQASPARRDAVVTAREATAPTNKRKPRTPKGTSETANATPKSKAKSPGKTQPKGVSSRVPAKGRWPQAPQPVVERRQADEPGRPVAAVQETATAEPLRSGLRSRWGRAPGEQWKRRLRHLR